MAVKFFALIAISCAALALVGCGGGSSSAESGKSDEAGLTEPKIKPPKQLPKELTIKDLEEGSGPEAVTGDEMTIKFLAVGPNGKVQYSSWNGSGEPTFSFKLGAGKIFPAWDKAVAGMKVGGRREVIFPSNLTKESGPLIYVIDLLELK